MTDTDRRLRELAMKATPGPWRHARRQGPSECRLKRDHWVLGQVDEPNRGVAIVFGPDREQPTEANAAFIAAANPAAILSLLDRLAAAEKERDDAYAAVRRALAPREQQTTMDHEASDSYDQARR